MAVPVLDRPNRTSRASVRPVVRTRSTTSGRASVRSTRQSRIGIRATMFMIVIAFVLTPVLLLCGSAYLVWSKGQVHDTASSDAIVVLGAAQFDGKPSPVLRARLNHGLDLWRQGVAPQIITVGGRQPSDRYTEAGTGRQWLIEHGVPGTSVVAVEQGSDTVSSLAGAAAVASVRGWKSITLVSDPAHMARTEAIANRLGFDTRVNSTISGDGTELTRSYVMRETGGYLAFELAQQWDLARPVRDGAAAE